MRRTHNRPIAQGRIDNGHAMVFALVPGVAGMALLIIKINQLTAWVNPGVPAWLRGDLYLVFKACHTAEYCLSAAWPGRRRRY